MFCPRCGVALSRAIERCTGCGADLRPLLATGFLNGPVGPAPSAEDPRQADAVRWMEDPTAPAGATFSPDSPSLASGGAAVDGALAIAGAGRAALAVVPLAPDMLDSDLARLGVSELPTSAGMDEESTWTLSSPIPLRPGASVRNRPRTDAAGLADEGPLEVGQLSRYPVSNHQIARHWRDGRRLPGVGLRARGRARVQGHSAGRDRQIRPRRPRSKRASNVSCSWPGR